MATNIITATYVSSTSFTVATDYTDEFCTGRVVELYFSLTKHYGEVSSSSYSAVSGLTTVVLKSKSYELEESLTGVKYHEDKYSFPHDHKGDSPGDGDPISHLNLTDKGTNTHAEIDTAISNSVAHIADTTKHYTINDSGTGSTDLWSASKINSDITTLSGTYQSHADDATIHFTEASIDKYTQAEVDALTWTESDITDLDKYTQAEVDALIASASGTTDHSALNNLDYTSAGHTGFQPAGDYATNANVATVSGALSSEIDSDISTHAANTDAHHNESHTIASHSDTSGTGAELNELTDGSDTSLHIHDGRYYTETELDAGQLDNRYYTETEVDALTWVAADITDFDTEVSNNTDVAANTSARHTRSHTMTSTSDHTAGNWKVIYTDGSGNVQELALGANGKVLTSTGASTAPEWTTVSGGSGSGGLTWSLISTNTNAVSGNGYLIDATGGNIDLTLPSSPSEGDIVAGSDVYNKATTNTITIARNGENIEGVAEDLVIDINGSGFTLVYCDATRGWEIVNEIGTEANTLLDLTDTPSVYDTGKYLKSTASGTEWATVSGGSGTSDHGELTGLSDDDHSQYLNTTRGDARYYTETELDAGQLDNRYYTETESDANFAPIAKGVTNGDSHDHSGGDGAQINHTGLSNIGTNTHAQIDTHIANTSNPHTVTAAQVGNGTAQWNANKAQGMDLPTPSAGDDNYYLQYNHAGTEYILVSGTGGGGGGASTLLELDDTPSSYSNGLYLKSTADGTEWATASGGGGATVPTGVDNAIMRYDGTDAIQDSGCYIDDSDVLTASGIEATGTMKIPTSAPASPENGMIWIT